MASTPYTPRRGRYSCESAAQTLEWMAAIAGVLSQFKPLIDAHVVNFFKDRLWELVDPQWMECLSKEPLHSLLGIPSGLVMQNWPHSLQEFVHTIDSLVMPRGQESLTKLFPDLEEVTLDTVLTQGMNPKKKHEIEILSALVNAISHEVEAKEIIDVGAGQGYLAQVLCFQYQHNVIAIDASAHHSAVTSERAKRIKKHYNAKMLKYKPEKKHLQVPQTVTCQILSSTDLSAFTSNLASKVTNNQRISSGNDLVLGDAEGSKGTWSSSNHESTGASLLLGLHACGDLSVSMLRAFVESEPVKALVCIGCCYNLMSEECPGDAPLSCGFPMSDGAKSFHITLEKNARDLSCQSADRWKNLSETDALQNFQLHAFRAAFQMVLDRYYPEVLTSCPSIGRQGKALRRQKTRGVLHSRPNGDETSALSTLSRDECYQIKVCTPSVKLDREVVGACQNKLLSESCSCSGVTDIGNSYSKGRVCWKGFLHERFHVYEHFEEFCKNGMQRLSLDLSTDMDLRGIWDEAQNFFELVGPFWSLRASLGPLLETYILLDRLLFLQKHASALKVMMFPLFNPSLSPRNMVIVAQKA